ncbi:hypothetical protein [Streptomyces swartbergensis]|uniref:hypothetical protein n=1 Tax=Streptomyces swartbergensis TaxID=487165 RepID=UPI00117CB174|nr:hypothetical protein [Streptomyces swartbergensis]
MGQQRVEAEVGHGPPWGQLLGVAVQHGGEQRARIWVIGPGLAGCHGGQPAQQVSAAFRAGTGVGRHEAGEPHPTTQAAIELPTTLYGTG